jgi:hypothetical protein
MPEHSQFLPTGYDLEHNERQGTWVSCEPGEDTVDKQCRVTDTHGTVIFEGDFLPVRDVGSPSTSASAQLAPTKLGWVTGPVEGSPVPLIALTDGRSRERFRSGPGWSILFIQKGLFLSATDFLPSFCKFSTDSIVFSQCGTCTRAQALILSGSRRNAADTESELASKSCK